MWVTTVIFAVERADKCFNVGVEGMVTIVVPCKGFTVSCWNCHVAHGRWWDMCADYKAVC